MNKFVAFAAAAATTATLLAAGPAHAAQVSWSVGINVPAPVVYAPAPVVYAPAPAYYAAPAYYPAPAAVAYAPAPVYFRPRLAYYAPLPVLHPRYYAGWRGHPYARAAVGYRVIR